MTQRAELRLYLKRQASMIDKPLDELVLHGYARRPDPRGDVGRVPQQADRAFGNHLGRRSIAGIAIALDGRADLTAVGSDCDEKQIVISGLPLFLRGALARLWYGSRSQIVVGRHDALGPGLTFLAGTGDLHLVVNKIMSVGKTQQGVGAMHIACVDVRHKE